MSRDLRAADIHEALVAFYDQLEREPLLAPYFESLDMQAHMPRIVSFWETLLFHTNSYSGNAFLPHLSMPGLTSAHFARWVATLESILDARFEGPLTERMKSLAHRIAYSMQLRLGLEPFEPLRAVGG
jgi:Truncated hemoglobins